MSSDSSNSSSVSGEEGNTNLPQKKQISPAKFWCFTLNNYTEENCSSIKSIMENYDAVDEFIIGKEVGAQGTPHLQGFCSFKKKVRPSGIFGIKEIHFEKCKAGRQANLEYCAKAHNILTTNMKIPKPIKIPTYEMLYDWQLEILDIIKEEPDDRKIFWYYGEQGIGKSQFQKYLALKHEAFILGGGVKDMKNGVLEYRKDKGYLPELIIVNLPLEEDLERLQYSSFEIIKDMIFYSGKYEGGMICGNNPHLFIFANAKPCSRNQKFIVKRIEKNETLKISCLL